MNKILLIIFTFLSFNVLAQETDITEPTPEVSATQEESTESVTSDSNETPVQEESVPTPVSQSVGSPSYEKMLSLLLNQMKIPDAEEVLWAVMESDYNQIKNNDFEYQKTKPIKIKEKREQIDSVSKENFAVDAYIKVGSYDFKKESYPITEVGHSVSSMFTRYDLDFSKNHLTFMNAFKSKPLEDKGYSASFPWKIKDTSKFKEIKIKKDEAEKLAKNIGMDRKIHCVLSVDTPSFKLVKNNFNKKKNVEADSKAKGLICYTDSDRTVKIAEL